MNSETLAFPATRASVLAFVSLFSGAAGLFVGMAVHGFLCVGALVALICGHMALHEIRSGEAATGVATARAGLILGYIQLALLALFLVMMLYPTSSVLVDLRMPRP